MEEQSEGGESELLLFGSNAAQGIREVSSLLHLLLTPWKNSLSNIHRRNTDLSQKYRAVDQYQDLPQRINSGPDPVLVTAMVPPAGIVLF